MTGYHEWMHTQSDDVLSLFSGAGGFSYGFMKAGLTPRCGAEIDAAACRSYEANVGSPCHNVDLSGIDPEFFRELLGGVSPFAIIGGPPCQGFSTAGPRNANDPRNRLIYNYLRIVASVRPRWFVFENVEGLLTSGGGGRDVAALLREFIGLGYSVRLEKVNFAAYGVPQTRKRVVIIGNRVGADFDFPAETNSYDSGKSKKRNGAPAAPTLDEALAGLGTPTREKQSISPYASTMPESRYDEMMRDGNTCGVTDHWDCTRDADANIFDRLAAGHTMRDLPEAFWHDSFRRRAFRRVMDGTPTEKRGGAPAGFKRLHGDRQSLTITGAASREFIHPRQPRPLTRRECARIQSFPDTYRFHGSAANVIQQIGNAVPPLAARAIASHLQELEGRFGADIGPNLRTSRPRLLGFVLTDSTGKSDALKRTESLLMGIMQPELLTA